MQSFGAISTEHCLAQFWSTMILNGFSWPDWTRLMLDKMLKKNLRNLHSLGTRQKPNDYVHCPGEAPALPYRLHVLFRWIGSGWPHGYLWAERRLASQLAFELHKLSVIFSNAYHSRAWSRTIRHLIRNHEQLHIPRPCHGVNFIRFLYLLLHYEGRRTW